MVDNKVIKTMLRRKSIREYKPDMPSEEVVETIVRAGFQAPFASQLCTLLLSKDRARHPFKAPLLFTVCVDAHKLELIMAKRGWKVAANDLSLLLFGIQDAILVAGSLVTAAESVGLGSCFLGDAPYRAGKIARECKLPKRVFPIVQLAMGYPAEDPPPRPRYPLPFSLFEGEYPELSEADVAEAMRVMDEGYLAQEYYRKAGCMVELDGGRRETFTFDDYGWTEHISRKWGQWYRSPSGLLAELKGCGFEIPGAGCPE